MNGIFVGWFVKIVVDVHPQFRQANLLDNDHMRDGEVPLGSDRMAVT
jgi:hypothetical protein